MPITGRAVSALAAGVAVLVVAGWYDTVFFATAMREARSSFDVSSIGWLNALGSLLIAGGVLLAAVLAWRSASLVVGIAYIVVGGFFALLPWLAPTLAGGANGASPILPEALAVPLGDVWLRVTGDLGAVGTVGAGMAIAGVATAIRSRRRRRQDW